MQKARIGLVGISGYAGMEVARILASHPSFTLTMACSRTEAGKRLGDFYPFLRYLPGSQVEISVFNPEEARDKCDIVFLAVPAGTSLRYTPQLLEHGLKVVDFSADFRLCDSEIYSQWYHQEHTCPNELARAVYGLPELYAQKIASASLIANPGCYPTSVILGLYSALKNRLIKTSGIVVDSKSGASGAGRKAVINNLFCEISDDFKAYGLPTHRHTPEIEQELSRISGENIRLLFTPHLVPMKRGILSTIYTELRDPDLPVEAIHQAYQETWERFPWIRVLPPGVLPQTVQVRGSMFCDIGLVKDPRTNRLIVLSAIDNLCRGASGQAIACANLMSGLPVETGLEHLVPLA